MTLRTPRRRISPRTKLRYRAIREFFRRALGSTSQQEIQINSNIAVNVTDLKRKIVGLEQQLGEVSKHCRDIACFENCSRRESEYCSRRESENSSRRESDNFSRRESENLFQSELKHDIVTIKEQTEGSSDRKSNGIDTQLIFKSSECNNKKSEESDYLPKAHNDNIVSNNQAIMNVYDGHVTKLKNKKIKPHKMSNTSTKLSKHKAKSVYDNIVTAYSTSSFHSLANTRANNPDVVYPSHSNNSKQIKQEEYMEEIIPQYHKDKKYKDNTKKNMGDHFKSSYDDKPVRNRKNKRSTRDLDPDFIADIIRRQYKPIKMFGRKESDVSQFSAPICRDQEFALRENIQEDPDLCSCVYNGRPRRSKSRCQNLNGMQSVCDARLYSSKKQLRHRLRRMHFDTYSNSDMYDLVPVKERSSPKTRRQFIENNRIPYEYYREVPPSPRTHRPRLNLKAQYYTELEDYMAHNKHQLRKRSPKRQKRYQECLEQFESDMVSEVAPVISERAIPHRRFGQKYIKVPVEERQAEEPCQQDTATMSSLQYQQYTNEQPCMTVDTSLNKTQETEIAVDKTDKALCEIKDILQTFLQEIKKDTVASQCDKSDIIQDCKTQDNDSNLLQDPNARMNSNLMPNSSSFNNYNVGQCGMAPYLAPFTNPCCYPVMPLCPMNCPVPVPNGYLVPSQSFTCTNCVNAPKESSSAHCCSKNVETTCHTETEELIKEIYKFVAQGTGKKNSGDSNYDKRPELEKVDSKIMTSRSAGGSCKYLQQDANVGTQPLKCYSKSCEALGSRMISEPYYSGTTASYSDTLLEKLSLEATTQSISETELDTETTDPDKAKRGNNKFRKVLRSMGLFKKKTKDVIEELSESESVIDVQVKPKKPPFRQEITSYMMHGQEYFRPPPVEPLYHRPNEYQLRPQPRLQPRPHDNQQRSHDNQQRSHDYQQRSHDYQQRHHEYPQRPHEYQSRTHEYPPRSPEYQHRPHEYQPEYHPPYNPGVRGYPSPQLNDPYEHKYQTQMRDQYSAPSRAPKQRPTAPPFNSSYETNYSQMQPPLCLKEIEIKSTGTQSERKMSIFKKFSKKLQPPVRATVMAGGDEFQRTFSTQTPHAPQMTNKPMINMPKPLFTWKSLQAKAMQGMQNTDPYAYSLKTQKELAAGDLKIRNAMLKKLFYKRNPFSPRNLIVRTLMGRDKSSFGDQPNVYRPRMFL